MPDLRGFTLADLMQLSPQLRRCGKGAASMEEAAHRVVRVLREGFLDAEGGPQLELVRLYRTVRADSLSAELREVASVEAPLEPETPVMVLLATAGSEEAWNDRRRSESHRAIPLQGMRAQALSPMIARLFEQFGAEPLLRGEIGDAAARPSFDVFHVGDAASSPFVPAKEFVEAYGVQSVVGFGAYLPPADLFAAILFTNVVITEGVAEMFKSLALSVKLALMETVDAPLFATS